MRKPRREAWAQRYGAHLTALVIASSVAGGARALVSQSPAGSASDRTVKAESSLGDLFEAVSAMPPESPGSLAPEEYAALLAYILDLNDYPAGDESLPADVAALRKIRFQGQSAK